MAIATKGIPQIFSATVMHSRKIGRDNSFVYKILFLRLPIETLSQVKRGLLFGINKFGILSVFSKDHGLRAAVNPRQWIDSIIGDGSFNDKVKSVHLLTLPRVFGYAFKPVSFWFCLNGDNQPIAVIAEVNNTFGETHAYLCRHADGRVIKADDQLVARKHFHVSPFIQRDGYYEFRFSYKSKSVLVGIDHFSNEGALRLKTTLNCQALPERRSKLTTFLQGFASFGVFPLILWQALKIWIKGIAYVPKPKQLPEVVTKSKSD